MYTESRTTGSFKEELLKCHFILETFPLFFYAGKTRYSSESTQVAYEPHVQKWLTWGSIGEYSQGN